MDNKTSLVNELKYHKLKSKNAEIEFHQKTFETQGKQKNDNCEKLNIRFLNALTIKRKSYTE